MQVTFPEPKIRYFKKDFISFLYSRKTSFCNYSTVKLKIMCHTLLREIVTLYALTMILRNDILTLQDTTDGLFTVCNFQWFFFLIHQLFFLLVPCFMLHYEVKISNPPPGSNYVFLLWDKIQSCWYSYWYPVREDPTMENLD